MSKISSYTIIVLFVLLITVGAVLISKLSFQLDASVSLPSVTVNYNWANMSGKVVEQEVTSVLESGFSRMKGIEHITSTSSNGRGFINITFDRSTNFDAARFEISSIVRQLYPLLPGDVSYPQININRPSNIEVRPFLIYTLNASSNPYYIQKYAEDNLKPLLASIQGINTIEVTGATPMEWHLQYKADKLKVLDISPDALILAIRTYIHRSSLGSGLEFSGKGDSLVIYLNLRNELISKNSFDKIPVTTKSGHIFYLGQLATIQRMEREPQQFYRINGLNTINIAISANNNANHLKVSKAVKEKIALLEQQLPAGYKLLQSYDSTEFVKDELKQIGTRTLFTVVILLLLIMLVNRQWKYILLITLTLIASLTIATILYFVFEIQMHLYSLIGITVSLGMILDNAILMIDHFRHKQNRKVFLALLAATLSTVAALSAIFFLPENVKLSLKDFSYVVIINLSVSLLVALFFIPALMEKLKMKPNHEGKRPVTINGRKRRSVKFGNFYGNFITTLRKRKALVIAAVILTFGLPVFLLPSKLEGEKWYRALYNKTLGNSWYIEKVKSKLDKALGGTLRLFTQNVFENSYYRNFEETVLYVRAEMPTGSTIQQLNELMVEVEKYLSEFKEIKQFQTRVNNRPEGSITIYFKKEYEFSGFPFVLRNNLIQKAVTLGGPDWSVYGVGEGFSNAAYDFMGFYKIMMYGYNYDELTYWGKVIKRKLLENPRIQKVNFLAQDSWQKNLSSYYTFAFNHNNLALSGITTLKLYNAAKDLSASQQNVSQTFINGNFENIKLYSEESVHYDLWDVFHQPVVMDVVSKFNNLASVNSQLSSMDICRYDQQYQLILAYDYVGSGKLGRKHLDRTLKEIKPQLPMGYSAKTDDRFNYWNENKKQYWLLLLIIVLIFFVCSILLESLLQPVVVIFIIPVSYIGLFLTFYLFDINFDQGGFAAFILLSGVSVNSSLYILNDFNTLKRHFLHRRVSPIKLYVKSFHQKIVPIMLTTVSTCLGLVPFIVGGQHEAFWFSLAAGTIGGIVLSLLGILLVLPALAPLKQQRPKQIQEQ